MDENHFLAAIPYVERNPVRAGLVKNAWDYQWSSASFRIDKRKNDLLVTEREPYGFVMDWKKILTNDRSDYAKLSKHTKTGRPLGNESFVDYAEKKLGRSLRPDKRGPKTAEK